MLSLLLRLMMVVGGLAASAGSINDFNEQITPFQCIIYGNYVYNFSEANKFFTKPRNCSRLDFSFTFLSSIIISKFFDKLNNKSVVIDFLILKNLKGFYLSDDFIADGNQAFEASIILAKAYMNFYDKNSNLIDQESESRSLCDNYVRAYYDITDSNEEKFLLNNSGSLIRNFKGFLHNLKVNVLQPNVAFTTKICPIVFNNAKVDCLNLNRISNSFIFRNLVRFSELKGKFFDEEKQTINSSIRMLRFYEAYMLDITKELLDRHAFKCLNTIVVYGNLRSIETGVFKPFKNLSHLDLQMMNKREFFHNSNNEWIGSINEHFNYDFKFRYSNSSQIVKFISSQTFRISLSHSLFEYKFPDEDICLFKHYNPNRLVRIRFVRNMGSFNEKMEKTCLMLFLMQNTRSFEKIDYISEEIIFTNEDESTFRDCNIEARLKQCTNRTFSDFNRKYFYFESDQYKLSANMKLVKLFGPIILSPLVAFVGFFFNFLTVLVIKSKKNSKQFFDTKADISHDNTFNYILANSVFNMIECALQIFNLMSYCLGFNAVYCSSLSTDLYAAYFKIYVIEYGGEIMKTCSNFTMLAFSIERYMNTLGSSANIYNLSRKSKFVVFIAISLVLSCTISLSKIFEYSTLEENFAEIHVNDFYENPLFFLDSIIKITTKLWIKLVYIIHYVTNDLILFLMLMIVDVLLVIKVKQNLKAKKTNILKSNVLSVNEKKKRLHNLHSVSNDTNRMLIFSLILNAVYRLPELVFYMHFYFIDYLNLVGSFYKTWYGAMCFSGFCSLLANLTEFIYLISYSFNIFFYYNYNKPFRSGFKNFFNLKK